MKKSNSNKKQSNKIAQRYELAYYKILNDLPPWKQEIIKNNNTNIEDRIIQEFLKNISDLAESEQEILLTVNEE
jgi:hypothetical protein